MLQRSKQVNLTNRLLKIQKLLTVNNFNYLLIIFILYMEINLFSLSKHFKDSTFVVKFLIKITFSSLFLIILFVFLCFVDH